MVHFCFGVRGVSNEQSERGDLCDDEVDDEELLEDFGGDMGGRPERKKPA
jgi:hypothetical protein